MSELNQKIRRITGALYRFSEMLPENEPLRLKIKERGLFVFERMVVLELIQNLEKMQKEIEEIKKNILLLESYLLLIREMDLGGDKDLLDSLRQAYRRLWSYLDKIFKEKKKNNFWGERKKRTDKILDLFKKKKEVKFKEILKVLPGVSQRTVQRDLNFLVDQGILEKVGDKKATTYVVKMS
jgi:Fic family protein